MKEVNYSVLCRMMTFDWLFRFRQRSTRGKENLIEYFISFFNIKSWHNYYQMKTKFGKHTVRGGAVALQIV